VGLLEETVSNHMARLPKSGKLDEVIDRLTELARASDVRIHRTQTNTNPPSGETALSQGFVEQRLSVEMVGDFPNFYTFLRALEDENRIIRIQEIELKRLSNEPSDSRIQATLQLRVFCRKAEAQP
jgi:Tfp pilus assembly protein PilO